MNSLDMINQSLLAQYAEAPSTPFDMAVLGFSAAPTAYRLNAPTGRGTLYGSRYFVLDTAVSVAQGPPRHGQQTIVSGSIAMPSFRSS